MKGADTLSKLFGTDGIRGPAGTPPLTPEDAEHLGCCLAMVLGGDGHRHVVIGRDPRESGVGLLEGLSRGLILMGVHVCDLGVAPTPAVAWAVRQYGFSAGVMITASHNPACDNGLKFFGDDGFKLGDDAERQLESLYRESVVAARDGKARGNGQAPGVATAAGDTVAQYMAACIEKAPAHLDGLRLVVDCANGAASGTTPMVLRALGAAVEVLNAAPDGRNINDHCGSMHPGALQQAVRDAGAHAGIAHDGDADRVVFCDETGALLDGDEMMALAALDMAQAGRLKRPAIVATVMSNLGLDATLAQAGIEVIRCAVGDRHVVETLRREGLAFGGEQSGHFIFLDHSTTGDGLMAALEMLAILRRHGGAMSALRRRVTRYPQVQHAVEVGSKPPIPSVGPLAATIAAAELALAGRGRVLVRYSGTEPRLRILVEAPDPCEADSLAASIRDVARAELGNPCRGQDAGHAD